MGSPEKFGFESSHSNEEFASDGSIKMMQNPRHYGAQGPADLRDQSVLSAWHPPTFTNAILAVMYENQGQCKGAGDGRVEEGAWRRASFHTDQHEYPRLYLER